MDKERFLKIIFADNVLFVDINNECQWENIMKHKDKIIKIESDDWLWDLQTNHVVLVQ